ncbi:MAG: two-component system, chemotaxis family, sensor histidine kinase and response regulator WspE [Actinomycetota bacterium]|nr:two-component system, chemotaxis family, sensor histidine kinase and response regulator WspE [Actinomycetota bacterium]
MSSWADDPELVATFRAEVDERLASLCEGLLRLEQHPSPRQLVAGLFRDAHTVKGSARMLGLDSVVEVAHRSEDLLGALRDGRMAPRKDLVDVLLVAAEAISRSLPGAEHPIGPDDLPAVVAALDAASAGQSPVVVPRLLSADEDFVEDAARPRGGESIRVSTRRVHDLLDVVGEAELEVRRMALHGRELSALAASQLSWSRTLRDAAATAVAGGRGAVPQSLADAVHALVALGDQLVAATRELAARSEDSQARLGSVRDGAMGLAMVPVRRVAAGFPQLVRELAGAGDTPKDVRLVLSGADVELDTRVLDTVADSLRHLVINAVDHGCETPAERTAVGKPPQATLTVSARAAGSTVVIEVGDDGRGVDEDDLRSAAISRGLLLSDSTLSGPPLLQMMFAPGFSTRAEITQTSGRGVGLDVVRTVVGDLSGTIEVRSERGVGTSFVITLPVTLGVLRCLIARVGTERYAVPVAGVVETIGLTGVERHEVAGVPVLVRNGNTFPLVDLGQVLEAPGDRDPRAAVVVSFNASGEMLGFAVDELEGEMELVVKELGGFIGRLPTVAGATIGGDGGVVLVLDVREIAVRQLASGSSGVDVPARRASDLGFPAPRVGDRPRVLVVEDSLGVRELQRVILEGAGYDVLTAVDGLDGAARLTGLPVDLVLSDVEMPGMDGFTLTRTIRRTRGWEDVPVVIMTSRGDAADQRAGLDAGASAYLLKSEFDQAELIDTVRRLVGR